MKLSFKEWLIHKEQQLHEAGFDDSGSNWFFGSYLLPSDAFDWQYAYPYPQDYLFLQSRWEGDRKMGRKFINMDIDPIIKQNFVTLKSNTMPGEESWVHRPDNRPNVTVDKNAWIGMIGIGKRSDDINKLVHANDLLDKTKELNQTFGEFISKYPQEAEDKPWVK